MTYRFFVDAVTKSGINLLFFKMTDIFFCQSANDQWRQNPRVNTGWMFRPLLRGPRRPRCSGCDCQPLVDLCAVVDPKSFWKALAPRWPKCSGCPNTSIIFIKKITCLCYSILATSNQNYVGRSRCYVLHRSIKCCMRCSSKDDCSWSARWTLHRMKGRTGEIKLNPEKSLQFTEFHSIHNRA